MGFLEEVTVKGLNAAGEEPCRKDPRTGQWWVSSKLSAACFMLVLHK